MSIPDADAMTFGFSARLAESYPESVAASAGRDTGGSDRTSAPGSDGDFAVVVFVVRSTWGRVVVPLPVLLTLSSAVAPDCEAPPLETAGDGLASGEPLATGLIGSGLLDSASGDT